MYFGVHTGPVASALMTVYGPQVVVIGGSLLSAVGIVCSAFAPNIWIMYITVGLMTGKLIAIHSDSYPGRHCTKMEVVS